MHALIDGDIIAYRAAFTPTVVTVADACKVFDTLVEEILKATSAHQTYEGFFTGDGNFRDTIAVTAGYKANRDGRIVPPTLVSIREHAVATWGFDYTHGQEADDAIGIAHTALGHESVIVSEDKDFMQLAGPHYSPRKNEFITVTPWQGLLNFYVQVLTGDTTDNIIGLTGIGPVKAKKLLADCRDEDALYRACLRAYNGNAKRVLENGRLLWIRRYAHEMWEPGGHDVASLIEY